MIQIAVVFIGLSLLLYVLLGGADFGAGIIEIFTGKKGINTISKAVAPVWEANHIWLIVVIVVMFNAFPEVYSVIMLYLHIPIMMVLFGIIFRGTAFTFRYYDPYEDRSHDIYTLIFKIFSLLTPFFLGVTLGAVIMGNITTSPDGSFYERFVMPWLHLFPISLGIFVVLLFAFLAAVYLAGEPSPEETGAQFIRYSKRLLLSLVIAGITVFLVAEFSGHHLLRSFLHSWLSLVCMGLATVLLPVFLYALNHRKSNLTRLAAGAQTGAILTGWVAAQFPTLIALKDAAPLTIYNAAAPHRSVLLVVIALFTGLALVIPLLIYLFKIFKFSD